MSAISFVFTVVFKVEMKNFSLFILSGIYPWLFFSSALSESSSVILDRQNILRQFNLPRQILPLSSCLSNFMNFLIGWIAIYPIFSIFNPKIFLYLPLFMIVLILNFIFVCGLSLSLSVLNVFFRDIEHALGVILMFWLWVTPVFYSIDMVPEKFRWVSNFNPVAAYVTCYGDILYRGAAPEPAAFAGIFAWAVLSIISGWLIFAYLETKILKRI